MKNRKQNNNKYLNLKRKNIWSEGQRFKAVFIFIGILFLLVFLRIIHIQLILGNKLREENKQFRQTKEIIKAKRGYIYDSNGEQFAADIPVYSLWMDANCFRKEIINKKINKKIASSNLGKILSINYDDILQKIEQNNGFIWIKKKLSFNEISQIKNLNYPGLVFQPENARYYPKQDLGGNIIGFVNEEGFGGAGIESTYDEILKGEDGIVFGEKDGMNNFLQDRLNTKKKPINGKSIQLTIDQRVQYIVDKEIKKINFELKPKRSSIIVMKTNTGEILAVGDKNIYNPNKYKEINTLKFKNMAFQETYEPGSTLKPLIVAAAINEGLYSSNSYFQDFGFIKVDKYNIKCWIYPENHGSESLTDAIANSCNPVIIRVALDLYNFKKNAWYDYINKFGLCKKTAVNFAGEATGILPPNDAPIYQATSAIGQGISITPIQLIKAISIIGNGGNYIEPYLIKNILDSDKNIIKRTQPINSKLQIISKNVSDQVNLMLKEVVTRGTGISCKLNNDIQSIGKTGTSEKVDNEGNYYKNRYILSYIGMAPYPNPEYTVLIIVDEPNEVIENSSKISIYYTNIMNNILKLFVKNNIKNEYKEDTFFKHIFVPDLKGMSKIDAIKVLERINLKLIYNGEGFVINQNLIPFEKVDEGSLINVNMEEIKHNKDEIIMINFIGMRLPEAIKKAEHLKLKIIYNGTGTVKQQNILPGNIVKINTKILLNLE